MKKPAVEGSPGHLPDPPAAAAAGGLRNENLRLRQRIARLEKEVATLRRHNDREQEAYDALERQLLDVEGENCRISLQFLEFGLQNAYLASLYAASTCLHETEKRQEVLEVIRDIVVHLIGSQELAVFELDASENTLGLAFATGLDSEGLTSIPVGEGLLGEVARTGEPYFAGLSDARRQRPEEALLSAGIPLKVGDRISGVLAVFRLSPQKGGAFNQLDHKLCDLLAQQAGASLVRTAVSEMDVGLYLH